MLIDKRLGELGRAAQFPGPNLAPSPAGRPRAEVRTKPTRRRKDFQATEAHKEKLEEDYHLLHRRPTASPDIDDSHNHLARYPRSFPCTPQSTNKSTLTMSNAELASSYAALILADEGVEITVREDSLRSDPPQLLRHCRKSH